MDINKYKQYLIETDPILARVIDEVDNKIQHAYGEQSLNNKQNLFSYMVGVIIGQKIRFGEARTIRSNLYKLTESYNFTPQCILKTNLAKLNIDNEKKQTINNLAQLFIDNNLCNIDNETIVEKIKNNNIMEQIIKIKGIGTWTVQTVMIEYYIDFNLFPLNDKHVNQKIKNLYNKDIKEQIKLWPSYRSIVFWYLWKYQLDK